jgi:hypothetical protein
MNLFKKAAYSLLMLSVVFLTMTSCKKEYAQYNDGEVVEDNYTGTVDVTSTGTNPAGDFEGDGNSGTYSFAWENSKKRAHLNFDITSPSGSVQMILNDARGNEVLNQTITGGNSVDTYSGLSEEGTAGMWLVTVVLTDFDGDGSYSLEPRD